MIIHTKLNFVLLLGLSLTAASACAYAQEKCEPFSVFADPEATKRVFIDHGEEGPSVGDRRVVHMELLNEAGDTVGQLDGEATHLHPDTNENARTTSDGILQFPAGVILFKVVPNPAMRDFSDASGGITSAGIPWIIIGGSGVFAGATGTLDGTGAFGGGKGADETVRDELKINISCR